MTARFSLVGRDRSGRPVVAKLGVGAVDFNPFVLHPGGRWERILTACTDAGRPMTRADLDPFWTPTRQAMPEVGLVVRIKCGDALGSYDVPGRHYLHDDGQFYAIEPPTLVMAKVTHWVRG